MDYLCFADLELKGELHSKRVEKTGKYTQNECRRCKTTLETSVKIRNFTFCQIQCLLVFQE